MNCAYRLKPRECIDWKKLGQTPNALSRDICSDLSLGDNGDRCIEAGGYCKAHFNKCESIITNGYSECYNNIPENPWEQCEWKPIEELINVLRLQEFVEQPSM